VRESVAIVEDGARRSTTGTATQPPSRTATNKPVNVRIGAPRQKRSIAAAPLSPGKRRRHVSLSRVDMLLEGHYMPGGPYPSGLCRLDAARSSS